MRHPAALSLFMVCLLILGASTFVLLKTSNSRTATTQARSLAVRQSLDQTSLRLNNLRQFKLVLPPNASPQAIAAQAQQQQQITQLQEEIANLQAQLATPQPTHSDDTLTKMIAVLGAVGGFIGSIATLITALKGSADTRGKLAYGGNVADGRRVERRREC